MAVGVFHSVTALVAAWSRQVSRMSKKLMGSSGSPRSKDVDDRAKIAPSWAPYLSRRVSLVPFLSGGNKKDSAETPKRRKEKKKKKNQLKRTGLEKEEEEEEEEKEGDEEEYYEDAEGSYGDHEERVKEGGEGVWKKTILMGEKCQPLDFSGVIYYDSEGRRLPELPPRSPMRSPLPSFSFPVVTIS